MAPTASQGFLLRMEAVNLAHFVYDTQDLSTVRGGGLMLLGAVTKVLEHLVPHGAIKVTTGASSGIFRFEANDLDEARKVRDNVASILTSDPDLKHATFVVDVVTESTDFSADAETLIALNRHRQMTMPSLAIPEWNTDTNVKPDMKFDGLRPATERIQNSKGEIIFTSPASACRRHFGRDQRRGKLYQDLQACSDFAFTQEFEELAGNAPTDVHHLQDKIAVIYVDGNSFGKIQRTICQSRQSQQDFDDLVQGKRKELLQRLIQRMDNEDKKKGWWTTSRRRRIETLLWGGDEIIWVVPAWKGWEVMSFFFEQTKTWRFLDGSADAPGVQPLTHSAGLVFCSCKAPIHRVADLAKHLAEEAKAVSRKKNQVICEVLESFDHAGTDLEDYWSRRYPCWRNPTSGTGWLKSADLILSGESLGELGRLMRLLKEQNYPTRQLHERLRAWMECPMPPTKDVFEKQEPQAAPWRAGLLKAADITGEHAARLHLAMLWDYVAEIPEPAASTP